MNALWAGTEPLWDWLLKSSWQAAVLVGAVLLVQWIFRHKLPPRWRHALWWLVAIRLLLPVTLESSISIFNWTGYRLVPASRALAVDGETPLALPVPVTGDAGAGTFASRPEPAAPAQPANDIAREAPPIMPEPTVAAPDPALAPTLQPLLPAPHPEVPDCFERPHGITSGGRQ